MGKVATSVFASFAPCQQPEVRGRRHAAELRLRRRRRGPAVRQIWDGIYGLEGHKAALPGGRLPREARASGRRGAAMSVGHPVPRWAGPRPGTFAPRRRSVAGPGVRQGRRGQVLGLAADRRHLRAHGARHGAGLGGDRAGAAGQVGARPAHLPEEGSCCGAVLGLILMFITASIDYRRIRRWTPAHLRLVAAAAARGARPVGQSVNGAKAWIALPGGFQIEPSEFAKLGLILSAAWLLSRPQAEPGRRPAEAAGTSALAALAAAPLILLVETRARPRRHAGPRLHAGRHDRGVRHPAVLGARPARRRGRRPSTPSASCTC